VFNLSTFGIDYLFKAQVMFFQDARDYQILFLSLFLLLGVATRDWTLRLDLILLAIATCCTAQLLLSSLWPRYQYINKEKPPSPQPSFRSALITALGLSLLLRSEHSTTIILAGTLAILSKFIFQFERKHFFNPANFGIISALVLTKDAWVSPGQWGDDWWYALIFLGAGGMVLKRVGRWDTTAAFLGSYAFLEAIRNLWLGWTWDVFFHRLMSGSLLLFALFMITDPRTIPNARMGRLIWAISIAILTFILRNQFFIPTAVFWALFALSPLTLILDKIWSAPRFYWSGISGVGAGLTSHQGNYQQLI
jgi:Na+-transporting NADH:ubiquinone oxidoreductase subunit NqrB